MPSITASKLGHLVAPIAAVAAFASAPAAGAATTCDKVASPSGSDAAAGTVAAPFQTAAKLAASLSAGETGCLRGGTYREDVSLRSGGTADARITLTSYPGERATLVGRFWVTRTASNVTISDLDLNGTNASGTNSDNLPSPTINGNNVTFTGDDVTNDHHAICFVVGSEGWGVANGTVLDGNRIHDCGTLPANNHEHGVYVEAANDTQIVNNLIFDNADRGVMFYPNAQRSHVAGNVIDGNGEGVLFSGDGGEASNDNVVEDNIITNSKIRDNVESWYPDGNPVGTGNVVRNNCISGGVRDSGDGAVAGEWGFKVGGGNVLGKNPKFVDRGAKDFRLQSGSPCAGIANGATGSDAARHTDPPANPAPSNPPPITGPSTNQAPSSSKVTVSLRSHRSRRGRARLMGKITRSRSELHSAAAPTRLTIQLKWAGVWYPLKTLRLHGNRFDVQLRVPASMRGKLLKLRAVVPSVARSAAVTVRVR
jgi:Right handed beta helix region